MRRYFLVGVALWAVGFTNGCGSTSGGRDGGNSGGAGGAPAGGNGGAGRGGPAGGSTGAGGSAGGVPGSGGNGGSTAGACAACAQPTAITACPAGVAASAQCNSQQTCCDGEREWECGDCGNVSCTWRQSCGSTGTGGGSGGSGAGGRGGAGGNQACQANADCQAGQVCYVGVSRCGGIGGGQCVGKPSQTCSSGCACLDATPGTCPASEGGTCAGTDVATGCWYCALPAGDGS
jgi:hypothetical protein